MPDIPGDHACPSWRIPVGSSESSWEDWGTLGGVRPFAAVLCALSISVALLESHRLERARLVMSSEGS